MGNPLIRTAIAVVLIFIVAVIVLLKLGNNSKTTNNTNNIVVNAITTNVPARFDNETVNSTANSTTPQPAENIIRNPVDEFKTRITKKIFGTFVTPQSSPVQPERFTGYHTAVDVEFTDTTNDIPVFAIADGGIVLSQTTNGYGGVFVMQFNYNGEIYTAIYGHIRPSTLPAINTQVKKGQQIAVLGSGGTSETDGERHHLHFGIHKGSSIDIKGYVQNKDDLGAWVDPLSLYTY